MSNEKPIILCGCHKSGSSLLRSLFDAVPGMFALPLETHFFAAARYPITYPYRRTEYGPSTPADLVERLERRVAEAQASVDAQSDGVLGERFQPSLFNRLFRDLSPSSGVDLPATFFALAGACFGATFGGELNDETRVVEKSVENAETAGYWLDLFPGATFVHIIRNPYANLVSLRKYKTSRGRFPYLRRPLQALANSFHYLSRNQVLIPGYVVVRYEDLVADVQGTMRTICEQVGIEYHDAMEQPSFAGRSWGGNSTSGEQFRGVSRSRTEAWRDEITALEIDLVNRSLSGVLEQHGYALHPGRGGTWRRGPGESVPNYLRNRGLLADFR